MKSIITVNYSEGQETLAQVALDHIRANSYEILEEVDEVTLIVEGFKGDLEQFTLPIELWEIGEETDGLLWHEVIENGVSQSYETFEKGDRIPNIYGIGHLIGWEFI